MKIPVFNIYRNIGVYHLIKILSFNYINYEINKDTTYS